MPASASFGGPYNRQRSTQRARSLATLGKGDAMGKNEKISYAMLFCALMLVKNSKMKLKDLAELFPFHGKAQHLAQQLAGVGDLTPDT